MGCPQRQQCREQPRRDPLHAHQWLVRHPSQSGEAVEPVEYHPLLVAGTDSRRCGPLGQELGAQRVPCVYGQVLVSDRLHHHLLPVAVYRTAHRAAQPSAVPAAHRPAALVLCRGTHLRHPGNHARLGERRDEYAHGLSHRPLYGSLRIAYTLEACSNGGGMLTLVLLLVAAVGFAVSSLTGTTYQPLARDNSIFMLAGAVITFCLVVQMKPRTVGWVNHLATYVFPIYIIHQSLFKGYAYIPPAAHYVLWLMVWLNAVALSVVSAGMEWGRRRLLSGLFGWVQQKELVFLEKIKILR